MLSSDEPEIETVTSTVRILLVLFRLCEFDVCIGCEEAIKFLFSVVVNFGNAIKVPVRSVKEEKDSVVSNLPPLKLDRYLVSIISVDVMLSTKIVFIGTAIDG